MYFYTKNQDPSTSDIDYDPQKGDLVILNAVIIWPDFSGRRAIQQYHSNQRSCTVMVPEDAAQELRENHINVKFRDTEDGDGFYHLAAKLSYHTPDDEIRLGFKPADPEVTLKRIVNGVANTIHMTQDDVEALDSIQVSRADLVLHHGKKLNQNGNFTLYISRMGSVYEPHDVFGGMYDDVPMTEDEDMPF